MDTPNQMDLGATLAHSRSGLRDSHRRSLTRLMFTVTGTALTVFACLQLLNGAWWVGVCELLASATLFVGVWRLEATPHLQQWIYLYLVALFSFFLVIMILPNASVAAFVWILMIPVLAYLLLGKREGLILSVPFMLLGGYFYVRHLGTVDNPGIAIDLLNFVLCASLMLAFVHLYEIRREEAENRLVTMAQTDALTGLPNRSNFQETLARTLAESERSGADFALVIMDIDHFKLINDALGHDAGDRVLRHIASRLQERLRATDFVGRIGGEEFGLILRGVRPAHAFELMDELRQVIAEREVRYGEARICVTASFGIAHWPVHGRSAETLFSMADRSLYKGKTSGRNCVVSAEPKDTFHARDILAGGAV
ncbi:diguanylate cyclase [Marinobacter salinisoli]|uniref:diguanylate cyclase n=1 Tax=Marinobacter salinisoli TaxID=2769486 RepID=A0ABX7MW70_9GAMM|nr:sensor domain-containing diguanylate cyclase [Marinobacter salinisoli]QSP95705.1 diguanylate cyclase [Marinobacter salinisoli]